MSKLEHLQKELKEIKEALASTEKTRVKMKKEEDFFKLTNEEKEKIIEMVEKQIIFLKNEEKRIKEEIKTLSE